MEASGFCYDHCGKHGAFPACLVDRCPYDGQYVDPSDKTENPYDYDLPEHLP